MGGAESDPRPRLRTVTRRRFLALTGLAAGALAAGVTVRTRRGELPWSGVPVRNPAYRPVPGDAPGHVVWYCQLSPDRYRAFELNPSGARIMARCAAHEQRDEGPSIRDVADGLPSVSADEVREFVATLRDSGLVSLAGDRRIAYFVRQEAG